MPFAQSPSPGDNVSFFPTFSSILEGEQDVISHVLKCIKEEKKTHPGIVSTGLRTFS